jgi:hypothetical protein
VDGQYTELDEGISTGMWNTMDTLSYPTRYERYAQLLMYPKADTGLHRAGVVRGRPRTVHRGRRRGLAGR